jgi:large subunit ribosomal protein L22
MPETIARLRYHQASASKVRQVMRLIVGKNVSEAREILRFCERGAAEPVMKVLDSAVANAEHNDNMPEDELYVARAFADEGPTMKRGRPRARGRYGRIKKRSSHLTIVVARYEDDELERRRRREAEAGAPQRQSRSRRVSASRRRAEAEEHDRRQVAHEHDHDHEDHDHDHEHDDDEESLVDELEAEAEVDEAPEAEVDTEVDDDTEAEDDTEVDTEQASDPEGAASGTPTPSERDQEQDTK